VHEVFFTSRKKKVEEFSLVPVGATARKVLNTGCPHLHCLCMRCYARQHAAVLRCDEYLHTCVWCGLGTYQLGTIALWIRQKQVRDGLPQALSIVATFIASSHTRLSVQPPLQHTRGSSSCKLGVRDHAKSVETLACSRRSA
jgi:hypothetical protein